MVKETVTIYISVYIKLSLGQRHDTRQFYETRNKRFWTDSPLDTIKNCSTLLNQKKYVRIARHMVKQLQDDNF